MPRTVTSGTTDTISIYDNSIIYFINSSSTVTVTLPELVAVKGRVFGIYRKWDTDYLDQQITINKSTVDGGGAVTIIAGNALTRNTGIYLTEKDGAWVVSSTPTPYTSAPTLGTVSNGDISVSGVSVNGRLLFDTRTGNISITLPNITQTMVDNKTRIYIGHPTGTSTSTLTINKDSSDSFSTKTLTYHTDGYISAVADATPSSIVLTRGNSIILYASSLTEWKDTKRDTTYTVNSGNFNVTTPNVVVYGSGSTTRTATLGTVSSYTPNSITINNLSNSLITVDGAGTDTINDTGTAAATYSLNKLKSISLIKETANSWITSNYNTVANATSVNAATTLAATVSNVLLTGTTYTVKLPINPTTTSKSISFRNTASGTVTIAIDTTLDSAQRMFDTDGYVASKTYLLATTRSVTFVYSSGLNTWVKA